MARKTLLTSVLHSPKRKAGGGGIILDDNLELNSPTKKSRSKFNEILLYWKKETSDLAGNSGVLKKNLDGDNRSGGKLDSLKD